LNELINSTAAALADNKYEENREQAGDPERSEQQRGKKTTQGFRIEE